MVDSQFEPYEYTEIRPQEPDMDSTTISFMVGIGIIIVVIAIYVYLENRSTPPQIGQ